MTALDARSQRRHRVHMQVRYGRASDFVTEYAENLSAGGLFVRGAFDLEPLEIVSLAIDLPGYRSFEVEAQVAHVLSPEDATQAQRRPGAGLAITSCPPEFKEALNSYLLRLGRRRERLVIASRGEYVGFLRDAGYTVEQISSPLELVRTYARAQLPVIGVVVTRAECAAYEEACAGQGLDDLFFRIDFLEEADDLLTSIDEML